ncbi:hypothetical protein ACQJBY_072390 [Aegilops geniculata]
MAKRPRNFRAVRSNSFESYLRRVISEAGLAVPGCCADDVAAALRARHPDLRRKQHAPLVAAVRRALLTVPLAPAPGADGDESGSEMDSRASSPSSRRRRHDGHATASSSTSYSEHDDDARAPSPPPAFDVTKAMLRTRYASLTPRKEPAAAAAAAASQQLEIELNAEKPRRRVTTDGGGGGDPKQEAGASEGGSGGGAKGPRFSDLGGMESVIDELMMEVVVPLCHPELPLRLGVRPVAGILLHGPPGCGKTTLAHAIANETGVPFYKISAPEVVSGVSGASEENIRVLFKKAYRTAPSIVFIDEIDSIASKRENLQREMERRIVTQLMTCMDEFHQNVGSDGGELDSQSSEKKPGYVIVIGATNRPDAVDQALRRPGRFDREISLGVPDEIGRKQILKMLTQNLTLEKDQFDLFKIARATPGFVGADLKALVDKAGNLAMKRIIVERKKQSGGGDVNNKQDWWRHPWSEGEMDSLCITMDDFEPQWFSHH